MLVDGLYKRSSNLRINGNVSHKLSFFFYNIEQLLFTVIKAIFNFKVVSFTARNIFDSSKITLFSYSFSQRARYNYTSLYIYINIIITPFNFNPTQHPYVRHKREQLISSSNGETESTLRGKTRIPKRLLPSNHIGFC